MNPHWNWLYEFAHYEKLTNGPDPHISSTVDCCRDQPVEEQIWRTLAYSGPYNVPSGEVIWTNFPYERYKREPEALQPWLAGLQKIGGDGKPHWAGLAFRRERKGPTLDFITRYMRNIDLIVPKIPELKEMPFDKSWEFCSGIYGAGRYFNIKLHELWYRLGILPERIPDVRAKGGPSPRKCFTLLYPEVNHQYKSDTPFDIAQGEELGADMRQKLKTDFGLDLTTYENEVFACNFKSAVITRRHYPGRSLDSELAYETKLAQFWGERETDHLTRRRVLYPEWALGELQGWPKTRDELGKVLGNHGYTWSDAEFDYHTSKANLASPVAWPAAKPGELTWAHPFAGRKDDHVQS
jgi:hypothetical protein